MTRAGRYMALVASGDAAPPTPTASLEGQQSVCERVTLAIARAAEHGLITPTCLERAVALERLLRRNGVGGGRIRVGVRWEGGQFLAHAWVELGGVVLADSPTRVRSFTSFARAETLPS